jgi:hypothetical protein
LGELWATPKKIKGTFKKLFKNFLLWNRFMSRKA